MTEKELVNLLNSFCIKLFTSKKEHDKTIKFTRTKEGILLIDDKPTLYSKLKENG